MEAGWSDSSVKCMAGDCSYCYSFEVESCGKVWISNTGGGLLDKDNMGQYVRSLFGCGESLEGEMRVFCIDRS